MKSMKIALTTLVLGVAMGPLAGVVQDARACTATCLFGSCEANEPGSYCSCECTWYQTARCSCNSHSGGGGGGKLIPEEELF